MSHGSGSVYSDEHAKDESVSIPLPTYPPPPHRDDTASIAESFTSTSSRKARPESLLMSIPDGQLVLGVALVDFNHVVRCSSLNNEKGSDRRNGDMG